MDVFPRGGRLDISMPLLLLGSLSHYHGSVNSPRLVGDEVSPTRIIDAKLIATVSLLLISLSPTSPETAAAIVTSVCKSVVLVVETKLVGHTLPL